MKMDCFEKLPIEIKETLAKTTWDYLNGDLDKIATHAQYEVIKNSFRLCLPK